MRTAYLFHRVRQGTVLHKVPQLDTAVQQEHSLRPYHLGIQLENLLGVMFLSQVAAEKDRLESQNLGLDTSWPFGAVEECGKERGNQREQRGLLVIISPQFRLGCGHRWVASSLVSARLCGLRVEASLRRDCCSELCRNASGR